MTYCACECGRLATPGKRFIRGHHMRGRKFSDETKEKMSKSKKGANHPLFEKGHSEKSRKKMSDSRKALWKDEEFVIKILKQNSRKRREERNV